MDIKTWVGKNCKFASEDFTKEYSFPEPVVGQWESFRNGRSWVKYTGNGFYNAYITKNHETGKLEFNVTYYPGRWTNWSDGNPMSSEGTEVATGFATMDEAKTFADNHEKTHSEGTATQ